LPYGFDVKLFRQCAWLGRFINPTLNQAKSFSALNHPTLNKYYFLTPTTPGKDVDVDARPDFMKPLDFDFGILLDSMNKSNQPFDLKK